MKSLAMNQLFSKSSDKDLPKINSSLEMLLTEQRHQRSDLATLLKLVTSIINSLALQKQVDDYYPDANQADDKEPD